MSRQSIHPSAWLSELADEPRSLDVLLDAGFIGVDLADLLPWFARSGAAERIMALDWLRNAGEQQGQTVLVTADGDGLDALLEWMLETHGECPRVWIADEPPRVPDALGLLRPEAYNIPEGTTSEELMDEAFLDSLAEVFAGLKQSFGSNAHLYRLDYGTLIESVEERNTVILQGQFIDLNDGEIFDFCVDGEKQKLHYTSSGHHHPAFRPGEAPLPQPLSVND